MAWANLEVQPEQFLEILDEEFSRHVEVAKSILPQLKKPNDKMIAANFIKKCLGLDAPSIEVKSNRNDFFKYFLKMLQTAVSTQPAQYDTWFRPKRQDKESGGHSGDGKIKESNFWSPDKRTYVAAKTIPDFGTLIYMAVAYKPELGWQPYGFSAYEF